MQNNFVFFEYYSVSSLIHRLSSIFKIISSILIIISLFNANSVIDFVVINLYIFVIMLWSNIGFSIYYNNLKVFKWLFIFIFVVASLLSLNIITGFLFVIRCFDIIIYFIIITITTSLNDMVNGIYRLFKPFRRFFDINEFSLECALYFKFFGICYDEYNRIKISKSLRGVRVSSFNVIDKIDYLINGIKPVLKRTVDRLYVLKKNMYIRNYGVSNNISNFRLNKWGSVDMIMLIVNVLIVFISFMY